ncbi:hypothetical protein, partial [Escherichia coli]|uniref:hypothetical protein n=1 Tax=Escherichia coli TaxID=562 RepID=UPI0039E0BBD2
AAPFGESDDIKELQQNRRTGSRSIANVRATRRAAEASGIQVILGTGHYYDTYLDKEWFDRTPTNALADFLIADLLDEIP